MIHLKPAKCGVHFLPPGAADAVARTPVTATAIGANHNHGTATVHAAATVGAAMEATTAAAGDLNDVSIHT